MADALCELWRLVTHGHMPYRIEADFVRLQLSHKSSMLRTVLLPPFATGIMWSYSSLSRLPHLEHLPSSRLQTSRRTSAGIGRRDMSPELAPSSSPPSVGDADWSLSTRVMSSLTRKCSAFTAAGLKASWRLRLSARCSRVIAAASAFAAGVAPIAPRAAARLSHL